MSEAGAISGLGVTLICGLIAIYAGIMGLKWQLERIADELHKSNERRDESGKVKT